MLDRTVQSTKDQATRLRELVRGPARAARVLAVASGKGGVGKTNLAVNLSVCLAARGMRTTLVDLDMGLANADLLMNIRSKYTLSHVLRGQRTLDEVAVAGPGGLRFIPGGSGVPELANMSEFERQNLLGRLEGLTANTDMLVLDCGAGISRNVISFAAASDRTLVVTTPQPTALTDAYALIKTLHREQCRCGISVVVNMSDSRTEARAAYRRIASVAERFLNYSVADGGYMLHDTSVELAVQQRTPFVVRYPTSNASVCVSALADEFASIRSASDSRGGFLRRVVGLFA
jgi:flagellar biosynthesis protein FlhG